MRSWGDERSVGYGVLRECAGWWRVGGGLVQRRREGDVCGKNQQASYLHILIHFSSRQR